MFYTKYLQIIEESEGYLDDWGIWHPGEETVVKTICCDIQPYSAERLYRDYGYQIEVTKRVFCNPDPIITVGTICKYKEERYVVKKVIEWDDYWELMLNAENS